MGKFVTIFGLFRMFYSPYSRFLCFFLCYYQFLVLVLSVFLSMAALVLCKTHGQFTVDVLLFDCVIFFGLAGLEVFGDTS